MGTTFSQMWPPVPTLTEKNLPSQRGKVFIVTGGASGVGLALSQMLYSAGGSVYVAGRSRDAYETALTTIKQAVPSSEGSLNFLHLDLADLATIKPAVEAFQKQEGKLHILWNNAAVSLPPAGSVSAQGTELMMATNCLGHYLLTQLLLPSLLAAARDVPPASVRVVWASSLVVDMQIPTGGFNAAELEGHEASSSKYLAYSQQLKYATTKLCNWYLAAVLAKQVGDHGILSVTQNPGNLNTNLTRHMPRVAVLLVRPLLYEGRHGAYTELWAGLSGKLGMERNGAYVVPWGRVHPTPRADLVEACRGVEEGGKGLADGFAEWCEKMTREFR